MIGLLLFTSAFIIFLSYLVWGRADFNYWLYRMDIEGTLYYFTDYDEGFVDE